MEIFAITNKKALIIGVDRYDSLLLAKLPSCKNDAIDLFDFLPEIGFTIFGDKAIVGSDFERNGNTDAAWHTIESAYKDFFMNATAEDILLFYFSGHGINIRGEIYLSSPNVNPSSGFGGLPLSELMNLMNRCYCKQIVCIVDACYSGSLKTNDLANVQNSINKIWERSKPEGVHLLLSSEATEKSRTEKGSNSTYTKYLLAGFRGVKRGEQESSGSLDEYGYLTPKSLHQYVYQNVAKDTDDKQHPVYSHEGGPDISLFYYQDKSVRNPEKDSEVERIVDLSLLAAYYNVDLNRNVKVRPEFLQQLKNWIQNWEKSEIEKRKKILLITGIPGCGKSWVTHSLMAGLFNGGHPILKIMGDKIDKYPIGPTNSLSPIFILDDRQIGLEGIIGGVPVQSICNILEKSIQFNFAGPVVISMRRDMWKKLVSGSIASCKVFPESEQEKIVELKEIEMDNQEAVVTAEKILRSFYETTDGKKAPYRLLIEDDIKKKIIQKSKCNLIILKILLEDIGRRHRELDKYKITYQDIEKIISEPIYYILQQLFDHYCKTKNPDEIAEILGVLHYAATGSMSLGSLFKLWVTFYLKKSRPLPKQVYTYLSYTFTGKKPYEWPPPLFDIDRYGSIISFHGSVDKTIIKLLEDPAKLIRELESDSVEYSDIESWNRENIDKSLELVRINIDLITDRVNSFREQYSEDIENWINSTLEKWEREKEMIPNKAYGDKNVVSTNLNIFPQDAYYFLSMFKEFVEPKKEFLIHRYQKFGTRFERVFNSATIEGGLDRGQIVTTINRLLYYLFENAASEGLKKNKGKRLEKNKGKLLYQYGAYETDLDLMLEAYFPDKNVLAQPIVSNDYEKLLLFRRIGLALMTIGQLDMAETLYDKSYNLARQNNKWLLDAAKVLQLKSELYIHQGKLEDSMTASKEAITLYMKEISGLYCSTGEEMWGVQNIAMGPIQLCICALSYQAWVLHLAGCHTQATVTFEEAETLARAINPKERGNYLKFTDSPRPMYHLRDLWGIYYADHLLNKSDLDSITLAKSINDENLAYAKWNNLTEMVSQCYRVMADIYTWYGDESKRSDKDFTKFYEKAGTEYVHALEIAQKTSHVAVLTEARLGLGNWLIKKGDFEKARFNLEKSYKLDETMNYKFYKAELEIALAKAYDKDDSERSARYSEAASKTSEEIHYYRLDEAKSLNKRSQK